MSVPTLGFACIILLNAEGSMLLEHRAKDRKRYDNCWALFGGHVEEGETPEQAVRRETEEELGYVLKNPELLFNEVLASGEKFVFIEWYDESQPLTVDPRESQEYGWFTFAEWQKLDAVLDHDGPTLQKVEEHVKSMKSDFEN